MCEFGESRKAARSNSWSLAQVSVSALVTSEGGVVFRSELWSVVWAWLFAGCSRNFFFFTAPPQKFLFLVRLQLARMH